MNATVGTPISGTSIGLGQGPEGIVASGTTDSGGNVTFTNLKPGNYKLALPDLAKPADLSSRPGGPAKLRVTSFLNGKVQASADFPVGSSVGTTLPILVTSAKDSVTLKLEAVR